RHPANIARKESGQGFSLPFPATAENGRVGDGKSYWCQPSPSESKGSRRVRDSSPTSLRTTPHRCDFGQSGRVASEATVSVGATEWSHSGNVRGDIWGFTSTKTHDWRPSGVEQPSASQGWKPW